MKLRTKFAIGLSLALFVFGICGLLGIFSDTTILGAAISSPLWTFIAVYAQEKHADLAVTLVTLWRCDSIFLLSSFCYWNFGSNV